MRALFGCLHGRYCESYRSDKEDYGAGIYLCCLTNSTGNKILNCTCYDNKYGIWFHNWIFNITVSGCNIKENECGLLISIGGNNTLYHNIFENNDLQAYDSNINNWYSTAVKYGLSGIPRILIGNKIDLKDERKIILPMAEHLSEKIDAPFFETSALTGENVPLIFQKIAELTLRSKLEE